MDSLCSAKRSEARPKAGESRIHAEVEMRHLRATPSANAKYFRATRDVIATHDVTQKPAPCQIRDSAIIASKFFFRESAS
jgi:hypothetical protein